MQGMETEFNQENAEEIPNRAECSGTHFESQDFGGRHRRSFVSSKTTRSTQRVPGQVGLHSDNLFFKKKEKRKKAKLRT